MRIRAKIRYYIQRYRCRKKNCTICKYFTKDNECAAMYWIMDQRWYFLRYVALVTNCEHFEKGTMTEKESLMSWLRTRYQRRDRAKRMMFGNEQVDEWNQQIDEHFHGKKADLIIMDDMDNFDDMDDCGGEMDNDT